MGNNGEQLRMLVIGVGNRLRGDDAAGPRVADNIRSRALPGVHIIDHSGEGASLMEAWQSGETVFLVDAADSGGESGQIYEFAAHERSLPARFFRYSTHAFSVAESIELARVLDRLPARLHVYAIEGRDFGAGGTMSTEVSRAVEVVSDRIEALVLGIAHGSNAESDPCTNSVS
ncbi:MAG: hydrogenase maturation protease [Candidatus Hydrogenedentes bacterium]|nr:hydrogenase maturation protease [Candidatus Hydrogenedentota bacterium]